MMSSIIRNYSLPMVNLIFSVGGALLFYDGISESSERLGKEISLFLTFLVGFDTFLLMQYIEISVKIKSINNISKNIFGKLDKLNGKEIKMEEVSDYLHIFNHDEYRKRVARMIQNIRVATDKDVFQEGKTDILRLYKKSLIEHLDKRNWYIEEIINEGRILVEEEDVRTFWSNIIGMTENSIWTTNISVASFGRKSDIDLLNAQKAAIKVGGVKITRVFVFERNGNEELEDLKNLIREQIKIGVNVLAIEREAFNGISGNYVARIGGEDFMVLDKCAIYLTKMNEIEKKVRGGELIIQSARINEAIKFSRSIMLVSKPVSADNISEVIF